MAKRKDKLVRTETVSVHHPDAVMGEHRVERVIDSIAYLMPKKGGGKRCFPLEYAVAIRIRRSFDLIHGQSGGASDFDRARGVSGPSMGPPTVVLDAAKLLSELSISGVDDLGLALVDLVVTGGRTLAEVTQMRLHPSQDRNFYGRKLKEALRQIAEFWGWEQPQPAPKIRGLASELSTDVPDEVVPLQVMHAGGGKVYPLRRVK